MGVLGRSGRHVQGGAVLSAVIIVVCVTALVQYRDGEIFQVVIGKLSDYVNKLMAARAVAYISLGWF